MSAAPYALGLELANDAVRLTTARRGLGATDVVVDPGVEIVVPALVVEDDRVVVGNEAVQRGAGRPTSVVTDVVGQFNVDRLFLTGGRMLTPDEALRELLSGILATVNLAEGGAPAATTVVRPARWDGAAADRVARILDELGLPAAEVVSAADLPSAPAAAGRAGTRLPAPAVVGEIGLGVGELPALTSDFKGPRPGPAPADTVPVPSAPVTAPWRAVAVFVGVVGAIVLGLGVAVVRSRQIDTNATTTTTVAPVATTRPVAPPVPTTAVAGPTEPLRLGFVTQRTDGGSPIRAVVDGVNAAGGAFGHDVELLAGIPPDLDVVQEVAFVRARGGVAVITDATGPALDAVVQAAGPSGAQEELAVCAAAGAPTTPVPPGRTVLAGPVNECVDVLVLAALEAGDPDPLSLARSARDVLVRGVACTSLAHCQAIRNGGNAPFYNPPGRAIRLVPTPDPTR